MLPAHNDNTSNVLATEGLRQAFAKVTELLQQGAADGVYPGADLLVGRGGDVVYRAQVGQKWAKPPEDMPNQMTRDTVFDLAGLSSVVITTTLLMKFVELGKLRLEDRFSRFVQGFGVAGKSAITIEHLLSHASGMPAWIPFYEELVRANSADRIGILTSRGARDYIYNSLNRVQVKFNPGSKQLYSDLGFILLGEIIESLTGVGLDKAAHKYILQPIGMKSSSFIELAMIKRRGIHPVKDRIAPTEECPWRRRVLCGEVHDDNAWAMGGIAGHSGLFSTASDLHLFATEILKAFRGQSEFLRRDTVMRFFAGPQSFEADGGYRLGWESPNRENNMSESKLSELAVGHCGFTGCSLWLEPTLGVDIILLTNRIHPSRSNKQIRNFRPQLHDAILNALTGH